MKKKATLFVQIAIIISLLLKGFIVVKTVQANQGCCASGWTMQETNSGYGRCCPDGWLVAGSAEANEGSHCPMNTILPVSPDDVFDCCSLGMNTMGNVCIVGEDPPPPPEPPPSYDPEEDLCCPPGYTDTGDLRCLNHIDTETQCCRISTGNTSVHAVNKLPCKENTWRLCNQLSDGSTRDNCLNCLSVPGIWTAVGCIPTNPTNMIQVLIRIGLMIGGGVALLIILAGSFVLSTSQGDPKKTSEAKEMITSALIGLVFIIFSVSILQLIGVQILQLPGFGN